MSAAAAVEHQSSRSPNPVSDRRSPAAGGPELSQLSVRLSRLPPPQLRRRPQALFQLSQRLAEPSWRIIRTPDLSQLILRTPELPQLSLRLTELSQLSERLPELSELSQRMPEFSQLSQ